MSDPTTKQLKEERTEDGWIETLITPVINLNIKPHGHDRFRPSAYSFPPKVSYDMIYYKFMVEGVLILPLKQSEQTRRFP